MRKNVKWLSWKKMKEARSGILRPKRNWKVMGQKRNKRVQESVFTDEYKVKLE